MQAVGVVLASEHPVPHWSANDRQHGVTVAFRVFKQGCDVDELTSRYLVDVVVNCPPLALVPKRAGIMTFGFGRLDERKPVFNGVSLTIGQGINLLRCHAAHYGDEFTA